MLRAGRPWFDSKKCRMPLLATLNTCSSPTQSRTRRVPDRSGKLAAHRRPYMFALWARGANLYWMFTRHRNNLQYDARKLNLPHATEFLRKLSAVWARTLKRTPALSQTENFKITSVLRGSKLLTWSGASMSRAVSARLPRKTLFWISKSQILIILGLIFMSEHTADF
jgi:hypothetical protein